MATEFYKSIPEEIKGKLDLYHKLYGRGYNKLEYATSLNDYFQWNDTPEKFEFWYNHHENNTFPQWSDELNRFIDPPQVNTITVNADEYQAMRDFVINNFKGQYEFYRMHKSKESHNIMAYCLKQMGIDIKEITN